MEEKVGDGVLDKEVTAGHPFSIPAWVSDFAFMESLKVGFLEGFEVRDHRLDARLRFIECLFFVRMRWSRFASEASRTELRCVASDLNLAHQREHVQGQASLQEHRVFELLRLGVRRRFVEKLNEILQRSNLLVADEMKGRIFLAQEDPLMLKMIPPSRNLVGGRQV